MSRRFTGTPQDLTGGAGQHYAARPVLSSGHLSWNPENNDSQEQAPGITAENLASSVARAAELAPENYGAARQVRRSHAALRRIDPGRREAARLPAGSGDRPVRACWRV